MRERERERERERLNVDLEWNDEFLQDHETKFAFHLDMTYQRMQLESGCCVKIYDKSVKCTGLFGIAKNGYNITVMCYLKESIQ